MSKKTIAALAVAIAFVLTGVLLFGGSMTALDWDFTQLSTTKYETNVYTLSEEFEHLSIRTDTADVVLVPAEGADSTVTCYEQTNALHRVEVKNGTLSVEVNNTKAWYDYIGIQFGRPKITLSIPSCAYGVLTVHTDTGDVKIPKEFSFEAVTIQGSTGDISYAANAQKTIDMAISTGNVRIEAVTTELMNLSVSTGETNLTTVRCRSLVSDGNTGDLHLDDVVATASLSLHRSTGNVRLDGCDAAEIDITSDTGDVTGGLLSNKIFSTHTDTGRINVPNTNEGGLCRITTDTGDIEIRIQP